MLCELGCFKLTAESASEIFLQTTTMTKAAQNSEKTTKMSFRNNKVL